MADDKRTITTERGKFRFVTLDREEVIKGKPTGKQSAQIIFEGDALEKMKDVIEDYISDTFPAKKAKTVIRPFKTDEKSGEVFLTAKAFVKTRDGDDVVIPIADKRGELVKGPRPKIGRGSVGRLRVGLRPTEFGGKDYVGISLYSVKLLKLVEASSSGFGDEDDDYDDGDEFEAGGKGEGSPAEQDGDDSDDVVDF